MNRLTALFLLLATFCCQLAANGTSFDWKSEIHLNVESQLAGSGPEPTALTFDHVATVRFEEVDETGTAQKATLLNLDYSGAMEQSQWSASRENEALDLSKLSDASGTGSCITQIGEMVLAMTTQYRSNGQVIEAMPVLIEECQRALGRGPAAPREMVTGAENIEQIGSLLFLGIPECVYETFPDGVGTVHCGSIEYSLEAGSLLDLYTRLISVYDQPDQDGKIGAPQVAQSLIRFAGICSSGVGLDINEIIAEMQADGLTEEQIVEEIRNELKRSHLTLKIDGVIRSFIHPEEISKNDGVLIMNFFLEYEIFNRNTQFSVELSFEERAVERH